MSDIIPPIKIRKSSPEWGEISSWCEAHLTKYRLQLESDAHPVEKVPALRAQIKLLKTLLKSTAEDQNA